MKEKEKEGKEGKEDEEFLGAKIDLTFNIFNFNQFQEGNKKKTRKGREGWEKVTKGKGKKREEKFLREKEREKGKKRCLLKSKLKIFKQFQSISNKEIRKRHEGKEERT